MIGWIKGSISILVLLLSFSLYPSDARRLERERGTHYRTRSLIHGSASNGKGGQKAGGKADGKAGGKAAGKAGKKESQHTTLDYIQTNVQMDESKYWTRKSCKEKRNRRTGKATKASLCSPSSESSSIVSTESLDPSFTSTIIPSPDPSNYPSSSPSTNPTQLPSSSPSGTPTSSPTVSPSGIPTESPTSSPTKSPSRVPSQSPTLSPTESPSGMPSGRPSQPPTIAVETSTGRSSGMESYCTNPEPSDVDGGNFDDDQILVFQYLLFITDTIQEDVIVPVMEKRIHDGLANHFLTCSIVGDFTENQPKFHVWGVFSDPPDFIFSDCEKIALESLVPNPPSGSKCMVVQAELKMHVYFPQARLRRYLKDKRSRMLEPTSVTSADPQVITATGTYLNLSMSGGEFDDGENVLKTHFLAFVMEGDTYGTIDRESPKVAGVNAQLQGERGDSRVVAGAMTMVAAAICLIAVVFVSLRRRKERSEAYLQRLKGLSNLSESDTDAFDRGTYVVGESDDNSLDWFNDDANYGVCKQVPEQKISLDYQHDVHKCTSAYCDCHRWDNIRPRFIAPDSPNIPDILEDLRRNFSPALEERSYTSPDTVDL